MINGTKQTANEAAHSPTNAHMHWVVQDKNSSLVHDWFLITSERDEEHVSFVL
jgi:hypothetical protein